MIDLLNTLGMDIGAMTVNDWLGVFFALVSFGGMVFTYFMVLHPANKTKFEAQRYMAIADDNPIKLESM